MSLIQIEGNIEGLNTRESLSLAVSTLFNAGVDCHGIPISPGALYAMIAVQDRQANYAVCVLKSTGFAVSQDYHPRMGTLSSPAMRARL